jgi:tetratricopeptide (TPR) repeat protein
MAQDQIPAESALEIDRLATQLAKDPHSKVFMPLAEEYGKVGMWQEATGVLEDGLKLYPGFITAMVALGRAYDHLGQVTKAKAILEESVKLSPENLRAHRTLIKIYQSQGLNEAALQSCTVILAVNPRDEEVLSVQSALGGPLRQRKEQERPKPGASVIPHLTAAASSPPAGLTVLAREASSPLDTQVSTPAQPDLISCEPSRAAMELMERAPHAHNPTTLDLTVAQPGLDSQAPDNEGTRQPSPHGETVAQLEAWLRTIESRRHDRDTKHEPHPKHS